jgi:poly-gamma-glutamate synthesis protein (capsule biosynthesis protein)
MLDRGVVYSAKKNGQGNFDWLFADIPELAEADVLYGNLEGPLSDQGSDRHNLYSFRMDPAALPALEAASFDVLQIANNHIGDWGREAMVDTMNRLSQAGIVSVGAGENKAALSNVKIVERQGIKIGFLAATDVGPNWLAAGDLPGIQLASDPAWPDIISEASKQVDILVVGYHFGNEYQPEPSARQRELAHLAIDHGAKLVIGSHPHVVEPVEDYNGGVIAYSLGNFIFDQAFSPETMSGLALTVTFEGSTLSSVLERRVLLDQQFRPRLVP